MHIQDKNNALLTECRRLIQEGEVETVLEKLVQYCEQRKSRTLDEVLLLSAQLKHYQTDRLLGRTDGDGPLHRITLATLETLRKLEKNTSPVSGKFPALTRSGILLSVSVLLLLTVVIISLFNRTDNSNTTHGAQSPIIENGSNIKIDFHNKIDSNATSKPE